MNAEERRVAAQERSRAWRKKKGRLYRKWNRERMKRMRALGIYK